MAIVRNHGTDANRSSGTNVAPALAADVPVDHVLLLVWASDNLGSTTTPTVSSIAKPVGETASWVKLGAVPSSIATAGGGGVAELWAIRTTMLWPTGFACTVTPSGATTAKVGAVQELDGAHSFVLRTTIATGTSTTGVPTAGASLQQVDDVIGFGWTESATVPTGDADTTGGPAWTTAFTATTAGASATAMSLILQHKYATTGGGQTFTYNPVSGSTDAGVGIIGLRPTVVGTLDTAAIVLDAPDVSGSSGGGPPAGQSGTLDVADTTPAAPDPAAATAVSGTLDTAATVATVLDPAASATVAVPLDVAPLALTAQDVTGSSTAPGATGTLDVAAVLVDAPSPTATPGGTSRTLDVAGLTAAGLDAVDTPGPVAGSLDAPTVAAGAWDVTGSSSATGTLDVAPVQLTATDVSSSSAVSRTLDVAGAVIASSDPSGSAAISGALDVAPVLSAAPNPSAAPGGVSAALDVAPAGAGVLDPSSGTGGGPQSGTLDRAIVATDAPDPSSSSAVSGQLDAAALLSIAANPTGLPGGVAAALDLAPAALAALNVSLGSATATAVLELAVLELLALDPTGAELAAWLADVVLGHPRARWEALAARTREVEA